jgi:hypothetical protein
MVCGVRRMEKNVELLLRALRTTITIQQFNDLTIQRIVCSHPRRFTLDWSP